VQLTTAPQTPASLPFTIGVRQPLIVGFSVSLTVTVKLHVALFPAASLAVYVTVRTPTGNTLPLAGPAVCVIVTPGQLSAAVGAVQLTAAPQTPASLPFTIGVGQPLIVAFARR